MNIKLNTFFVLLIVILTAQRFAAQQLHDDSKQIDSLKAVITSAKENHSKVNALNALSATLKHDRNAAMRFAKNALVLSKKIKYKNGEAESFYNLGKATLGSSYFGERGDFNESVGYLTKALTLFKSEKNNLKVGDCLMAIGLAHSSTNQNTGEALKHFFSALKIYEKSENINKVAYCMNTISSIYYMIEENDLALDYSKKLYLPIFKSKIRQE